MWATFALVVGNSALLLVDHVHFQYNGLLLSLLLFSLAAHVAGRPLLGGALFAVLINSKHLYLVLAPVQFVHILRSFTLGPAPWRHVALMAATVVAITAAAVAPVVATGQLRALVSRCAVLPDCSRAAS